MRTRRGILTAGLVVVALAGVALSAPQEASARPPRLPAPTVDREQVRESIAYLMNEYHVSEDEAVRRLDLQVQAGELRERLARERPDQFGGAWIDQDRGGVLVLAMTEPAAAEPVLAQATDRSHIAVRRVTHSLRALERSGADAAAVDESAVQGKAGSAGKAYEPNHDAGYCHPLYCSRAEFKGFRGGLRLEIKRNVGDKAGTYGGCTSGFNLRTKGGVLNGRAWVLTAGHCFDRSTNRKEQIRHNGSPILDRQFDWRTKTGPIDYAVLSWITPDIQKNWLDKRGQTNRVMVYCRSGGMDSNRDTPCNRPNNTSAALGITGVKDWRHIMKGEIVCASGTGSSILNYPHAIDSGAGWGYLVGTRCGRVTVPLALFGKVGIVTDICARAGDSGGPLFSQVNRQAYGILRGDIKGQDRMGPCQPGEENNYSPVSMILDHLNSRLSVRALGSTFELIHTPNG